MTSNAKKTGVRALLAVPVGLFVVAASAALAQQEAFELLSRNPVSAELPNALYNSDYPAMTADGRYIVFESSQSKLVTPASNGLTQIILFDRKTNRTELVSANDAGLPGNAASNNARISADGCKVVFESYASNLHSADVNGRVDVYLRDRCSTPNQTVWISQGEQSYPAAGASEPDISADGKYLAYYFGGYSGRAGKSEGLYLRTLDTGVEECLSVAQESGKCQSAGNPSLSADGSRVAFYSYPPLVAADTNGVWDIYLYDRAASQKLSLVSVASNGTLRNQGNESASRVVAPAISADGRYVAFATSSTNLVADDSNGLQDVFLKNLSTGALTRVSVSSSGVQGNGDSPSGQGERPSLSGDGSWVVFSTSATNLAARKGPNAVAHNHLSGQTLDFATSPRFGSGARPVVSSDNAGRFVAFFSGDSLDKRFDSAGIFLHDRGGHCLMNWVETNLPTLFAPTPATSQINASLTFRYYPQTNAYLGVSAADNHLYYLPMATANVLDVGDVTNFFGATGCL